MSHSPSVTAIISQCNPAFVVAGATSQWYCNNEQLMPLSTAVPEVTVLPAALQQLQWVTISMQ